MNLLDVVIDYSIRRMRERRGPGESQRLARRKRALRQQRQQAALDRHQAQKDSLRGTSENLT